MTSPARNAGLFVTTWGVLCRSLLLSLVASVVSADDRPNILWIVVDDMSPNFSCYGETSIETPNVDQLAKEGMRFSHAYATSPVCSTFRSAMITGMYQTTIGSHHHRSGRGDHHIVLPEGIRPVPELFKEAGYYTCIGSGLPGKDASGIETKHDRQGKTDYNFDWHTKIYDSHDWAGRAEGQPFFMQVQLHGGKIRGDSTATYAETEKRAAREFGHATESSHVELPPYYPRDSVLLRDWATYLDSVKLTDQHVGFVLDRLKHEELFDNTLIVFFTDHGISHARGKQFLYDEGTHIPLVLHGPGVTSAQVRDDLVEHIDVAALSLAAAGIEVPSTMQGRNVLAADHGPKEVVFAARDRCGEATDRIRSVRSDEYLYIKNFYPERPLLMPSDYKDSKLILQRLRELHSQGSLHDLSKSLLFSPTRPAEELYLYHEDRWQTRNLALDPMHADALRSHRAKLDAWIEETGDMGPESPEVYTLETDDQIKSIKNRNTLEAYQRNVDLYRKWASQGM